MNRSDLKELHFITPIENVSTILQEGILCYRRAKPLNPASVAMQEVQALRANKTVPAGRRLHEYANLYICARNPMLFKRRSQHQEMSVLRVHTDVLNLPGVVIADGNAASAYTAFWPSPEGLQKIDADLVFAEYWTDADRIIQLRKSRVKCAEVLVPDCVPPHYIFGAYISCARASESLRSAGFGMPVSMDTHLFFLD